MSYIADAISSLCPYISFRVGSSYESIEFINTSDLFIPPSKEEVELKIAELEAAEPMRLLRLQRDQLLTQTDWWVLPDRTATQAQLDYRQALRDLPANSSPELDEKGQLINVNWPEKPE